MPTTSTGRPAPFRVRTPLALALTFLALAASDASAQYGRHQGGSAQGFYGPSYYERGYGDSIGVRGIHKLENGGYYGPPQIFSRQYGTIYGYRTARPFTAPRNFGGTGYGGDAGSGYGNAPTYR